MKILICEDNLLLRESLAGLLLSEGHTIVGQFENAAQLVRRYEHLQPDILILDIDMPGVD
ncbi:MAG: response regulator, partial [Chitinophagaceae bacterium]|nr:response regulator [Chitinophagaceae bacterium]